MTAELLLALAVLLALILAIGLLNRPTPQAALAALALLGAGLALLRPAGSLLPMVGRAAAGTTVLTLTVGYTLYFGLLLHQLTERSGALSVLLNGMRGLGRTPLARLQWVLLVFGPLLEAISGFGLGVMIAAPMLLALGYAPPRAAALSLLSQLAVPWGALAIGMTLGAAMVEQPLEQLGTATALAAIPGYLAFWGLALLLSGVHEGRPLRALLHSLPALAALSLGVFLVNRLVHPALGGIGGTLLAGLVLWLLERGGDRRGTGGTGSAVAGRGSLLRAAAPYLALVGVLVLTRFLPPVRDWLATHLVLSLPGTQLTLPLLFNPGASLLLACAVALALAPRRPGLLRGALRGAGLQAGRATLAVLLLVLIARVLQESGLLTALAGAGRALPPVLGMLLLPLLGAVGGFLTGSVAAGNALFINLQLALATQWQWPLLWVLALQNALTAAFTAFSPARLVFATVMTGGRSGEGRILRLLSPLAAALLLLGVLALLPGSRAAWQALPPWLLGH